MGGNFDFIILGVSVAPRLWWFYYGLTEHGLGVFFDGNYFLYWVRDGH